MSYLVLPTQIYVVRYSYYFLVNTCDFVSVVFFQFKGELIYIFIWNISLQFFLMKLINLIQESIILFFIKKRNYNCMIKN